MQNPIFLTTLEFKDSNCEKREAYNENEVWKLECYKNTDLTKVCIERYRKKGNTQEDPDGIGTCCSTSIRGPDFGYYGEIFLGSGTHGTINLPPIKIVSLHDDSESEIKCEVYATKERAYRQVLDFIQWNKWYFPSSLLEKKYWSATFSVLLKSDHDPVECLFRLDSFGLLFLTKLSTGEHIYFLGLFKFSEVIRSAQLILKPEDTNKYVCKFEHRIESRPSDSTNVIFENKVFFSYNVEDYDAVKEYFLLEGFRKNIHSLCDLENTMDVKLEVQGKIFNAHSSLLSARSLKFEEILSEPKLKHELKIEDLDSSTVDQMLKFVYSNEISAMNFDSIKKLYHASDLYKITSMKNECANYLKNNINAENADEILNWSSGRDEDVESAVLYFMSLPGSVINP